MNQPTDLTKSRAAEIAALSRSGARHDSGQFRIEGWRSVSSALAAGAQLVEVVVSVTLADDARIERMLESGCRVLLAGRRAASRLADVVQDQGILAVARIPEENRGVLAAAARVVALDGVQDPGNVGTIVRCAAWFGFDAVLSGPGTADFYNPKTVRSTAGALWDVSLHRTDNLVTELERLRSGGAKLVGTDLGGESLAAWSPPKKSVLILGSEAHGMRPEVGSIMDHRLRIDGGRGERLGVESLNVAVAAGILMHRMRV